MNAWAILGRTTGILLAASSLVMALGVQAGTIDVNSTTDAPATATALSQGVCADAGGACTLRAAIQVADQSPSASTINVPAGTYSLTVAGTDETYAPAPGTGAYVIEHTSDPATGDLNITRSMAIVGAGPDQTVIGWGATQQDRIFHIEAVDQNITVTLSGLTVQDGYVPDPVILNDSDPTAILEFVRFGGGIAIGPGAAIVVVNPTAEHGGGTDEGGGGGEEGGEEGFSVEGVTLANIHVLDNYSGADGGGIYNTAPLTVEDSIVSGNISATGNGGGIYSDGALIMTGTTVGTTGTYTTGNDAENGGGIFETGSHTSRIEKSAIVGNTGIGGGGLAGRSLVEDLITNTTIAGNFAQDTGGGIITNGHVTLTNDTVANNQVTSDSEGGGAGLSSFASGGGSTSYMLVNTILANNTIATTPVTVVNCGGVGNAPTFTSLGHNLEDADTCGFSATGDLTNTDPLLEPLAMNGGLTETMALPSQQATPPASQTSPAIDAGDNTYCPNNDQRDSLRPADGNLDGNYICDIGAYELFIPAADMQIEDMTSPDQVFVGDSFEVKVAVIAPSATTTAQGVTIQTGALPSDLTFNSASVTTPSATTPCTFASGVITCDAGALAPDAVATATISLTAQNPAPKLTVTAAVSQTSPTDPNLSNNTASVEVEALGLSNLAVASSTSVAPAVALGTETTIGFSVSNAGPHPASELRVGIELPPQLTYRAVTLTNATCNTSDPTAILCTTSSLGVGSGLTGQLTVTGSLLGTGSIEFAVNARERDTDISDNLVEVSRTVAQISDLALSGGFAQGSLTTGAQATLGLTLRNGGPSDATNAMIAVQLPSGLAFQSATGGVSCTGTSTVTCTIGTLAAGQSVQLAINANVTASSGTLTVTSTASADGTDPDSTNNAVTSTLTVGSSGGGGGGGSTMPVELAVFAGLLGLAALRRRYRKRF